MDSQSGSLSVLTSILSKISLVLKFFVRAFDNVRFANAPTRPKCWPPLRDTFLSPTPTFSNSVQLNIFGSEL